MTKKTRNWLIAVFIVAFPFVLFLGFLVFMAEEPLPPLMPLPNPNGYGDLVKAGKMIIPNAGNYEKADLNELREIVSTNAPALALARSAMSNQCGVPLQLTKAYLTDHIQDLIAFRNLAEALVCEGKLATKENRFGDAAKSCLDTIRFGNHVTRGGTTVDEMLGAAIWSLGEMQLQDIVTNLDAPECRQIAASLETLAGDRQTWAETMQQEEAWSRGVYGWRRDWLKLIYYSVRQKNLKQAMDTLNGAKQRENRLLVDLTSHAYELEKGCPPANVSDLVPDYLKAIPKDLVTGTNMVHLPQ